MLDTYALPRLQTIDAWIGAHYPKTKPRILVLAESMWGVSAPLAQYVPQWLAGTVADATFTALYNACAASKIAGHIGASKQAFWDSIAFYNFVPGSLSSSASRPTSAQFASGVKPLHLVLAALQPGAVLIFGVTHSDYSRPAVEGHRIPYVIVPHTRSGVPASFISQSWDILLRIAV